MEKKNRQFENDKHNFGMKIKMINQKEITLDKESDVIIATSKYMRTKDS